MLKKIMLLIIPFLLSITCNTGYATENYDTSSTYIHSMETKITAKDNFTFHVQQKITAHLNHNHGIFVNITFQPAINMIKNIHVKGPGTYEVSSDSGENVNIKTVKMGNEDKEYSGNQTWMVSYNIQGFQTNKDQQNNLSLSVVPAYWELPIKKVKTTIIMPKPIHWNKIKMVSGNPDESPIPLEKNSLFKVHATPKVLTIEGKNLPENYGASIGGKLPKHYWKNPILLNQLSYIPFGFGILFILIAIICLFKFRRKNKPVETTTFYPPNKMDSIKMGYFIDGKVDNKDIISMLFYFANEGFISIQEVKKTYSFKKQFKFIKKSKKAGYTNYQKTLLKGLFSSKGNVFETNGINRGFVDCLSTVKAQVVADMPKIYDKQSLIVKNILLFAGIICEDLILLMLRKILGYDSNFFVLIILSILSYCIYYFARRLHRKNSIEGSGSWLDKLKLIILILVYVLIFNLFLAKLYINKGFGIICGLLFVSYFIMVQFIKKRSDQCLELDGQILGFKQFIKNAELEQLNSLVEQHPEYFYRILPYAYIFGLTNKWAKHFKNITSYQPSWYDGESLSYNEWRYSICSTINDTQHHIRWDISNSSSSSSGGSSSDGGFGGGGGGVW